MAIPLKYNFRSALVRRTGTAMAVFSVAATVAVFVCVMALTRGLDRVFEETGHPLNLVVIRQGSQVEVNSSIAVKMLQTLKYLQGIQKDERGEPLVSPELVVLIFIPRATGEATHVALRGTTPAGLRLREGARLVEGRIFRGGSRELVVGRSLARRFALPVGTTLRLGRSDWQVVGLSEGGGSAYESELWADVAAVADDFNRQELYSSVLMRAIDADKALELVGRITNDRQLHLQARLEPDYYREQIRSSMPIKALGMFIAVVMAVGSCFAAMNAMYASVAYRAQEIATLRVLGFSRVAIMMAFLVEAIFLAAGGGALGCLLALPIHGLSTGTVNFYSFNEMVFYFRITPPLLLKGLVFALVVGLIGGLLPARLAAIRPIIVGLRA